MNWDDVGRGAGRGEVRQRVGVIRMDKVSLALVYRVLTQLQSVSRRLKYLDGPGLMYTPHLSHSDGGLD